MASALSPLDWGATFSKPPTSCSEDRLIDRGVLLRGWRNTSARMDQPALSHHYLVVHQGGPKKVTRRTSGMAVSADVLPGSITVAAAGMAHQWTTQGPIGFTHLYLTPGAIDHVVRHDFDRDPRQVHLIEAIGLRRPLLAALIAGLERQLKTPGPQSRLLLDTLVHHILVRVVADCSSIGSAQRPARHVIAPQRLARIQDFIEANLDRDLSLAELAAVAGSSRYHFSRSFAEATGLPPYRYLIGRRVEAAKAILTAERAEPIEQVARRCGFNSRRQFEAMFQRICGASPVSYRRDRQ